jgi:hypothetical protein
VSCKIATFYTSYSYGENSTPKKIQNVYVYVSDGIANAVGCVGIRGSLSSPGL